jgi:hypothetical protein
MPRNFSLAFRSVKEMIGSIISSSTRNTGAASLEQRLMEAEFRFDLQKEDDEEAIIVNIFKIITDYSLGEPLTDNKLVQLAHIIEKRLPVESHVTTVYKERIATLSKQQRAKETPKTVLYRIKQILTSSMTARINTSWN